MRDEYPVDDVWVEVQDIVDELNDGDVLDRLKTYEGSYMTVMDKAREALRDELYHEMER